MTDSYTIDIANIIADKIEELLGGGQRPHMIISNIKRSEIGQKNLNYFKFNFFRTKLDPNREVKEAAQNDPLMEAAWAKYHGLIDYAKNVMGRGIVFDVHKQGNR